MMSRARDEHGMITLWILGLTISVMFLGGLGLDFWRAVAVRREIASMADAAASAGANGLDEGALRRGDLQLDEARVRQLVAGQLSEYPNASKLIGQDVTVAGAQVNVTLREHVDFTLLGIFMGGGKFTVQASATAEPREIP
jgi:Putative Flp pilus-assembly TadE/G-like